MSETNTRDTAGVRSESEVPAKALAPEPEKSEDRASQAPSAKANGGGDGGGGDGDAPAPKTEPARLVHRGNPLRLVRGGATTLLGSVATLILMGHPGQFRFGVPLGALFVALASWGVMDLLGTFDDADHRVAASTTLGALARPLVGLAAAGLLFCTALGLAASGAAFPQVVWGVLVALTFIATTAALFEVGRALGAWKTDEEGVDRPLWKRHGFWVVVAAAALYFPFMGTYSLWDPCGDPLRRGVAR